MTWAKLHTDYWRDPKIVLAGLEAGTVFQIAIAINAELKRDGCLEDTDLHPVLVAARLNGWLTPARVTACLDRCVEVGLLDRYEAGFRIRAAAKWGTRSPADRARDYRVRKTVTPRDANVTESRDGPSRNVTQRDDSSRENVTRRDAGVTEKRDAVTLSRPPLCTPPRPEENATHPPDVRTGTDASARSVRPVGGRELSKEEFETQAQRLVENARRNHG